LLSGQSQCSWSSEPGLKPGNGDAMLPKVSSR
jgi:hypothetical protein